MGNYISCTLSVARAAGASVGRAKLVLPTGELLHVGGGVRTAAEFMLEYPGHFLVGSASLRIGSRFAALSADEDLEQGGTYVMIPMSRLGSVVGADDMARVAVAARKVARLARVSPAAAGGPLPEPVEEKRYWKLEEMDAELAAEVRGRRLSVSRSRKPMLETIEEESCSR